MREKPLIPRRIRPDARFGVLALGFAILLIFGVFPLFLLLARSFQIDGQFTLRNYNSVFSKRVNLDTLLTTLNISVISTLLAVVVAVPVAWLTTSTNLRGRRVTRTLFLLPYIVPHYVLAVAWATLLAPRVGHLNRFLTFLGLPQVNIYTWFGLVFVMAITSVPLVFLSVASALERMNPVLEEAARVSGAGRWRTLRDVTLPLVTPSIINGALLSFVASAAAFAVPAIIGSPAGITFLSTRILSSVSFGSPEGLREATALASTLMVLGLVPFLIVNRMQRKSRWVTIGGKSSRPLPMDLGKWRRVIEVGVLVLGIVLVVLPLMAMAATSLIDVWGLPLGLSNMDIGNYSRVLMGFGGGTEAFRNSVLLGIAAASIAVVLSVIVAYFRVRNRSLIAGALDAQASLAFATPGTVVALALIIAFSGRYLLNLYGTLWLLLIAYFVKYLSFGTRTLSTSISQIDVALEEASRASGASWGQSLRHVVVPLIKPSLVAAWFLVFMPSFGELTMSILLYGPGTRTVGAFMYELQTYADPQLAAVLGTLIAIVILSSNWAVRRLSKGEYGI